MPIDVMPIDAMMNMICKTNILYSSFQYNWALIGNDPNICRRCQ